MTIKWKRILSCIIFIALLILAIRKCADILEYKDARQKYTLFYTSDTNFDVIFLGTSHMWNHVLPMELWHDYGISSYNWGYSNCTPAEDYYLLKDIVKYTSPKVVVLDTYGIIEYEDKEGKGENNGKYSTNRIEQQHVQFDSIPLSVNKIQGVKDIFDNYDSNNDFLWNFIMYHNRWTELKKFDFTYEIFREKGSYYLSDLGDASFKPIPDDEKIEINSVCWPYYLGIIEFCEEQGIEVLCTYLPFAAGAEQQKVANTVGDLIAQYPHCHYINMLKEQQYINYQTDNSTQTVHLNYSGALKVTDWLGQYLSEHYELTDYRQNDSWIEDYKEYYEYKKNTMLKQENLTSYLVLLKDDDFSAEITLHDENLAEMDRVRALLENAGIIPDIDISDSEICAELTLYSTVTGEMLRRVEFSYEDAKSKDLFSVKKL